MGKHLEASVAAKRRAAFHIAVSEQVAADVTKERAAQINAFAILCYAANAKWWHDLDTGEPIARNDGELICLMHSELSEALEALRKDTMDDKLPHRKGVEVELADTLIRIFDYCGARHLDIGGAFVEKLAYNAKRADHKRAQRVKSGGKKF